MAERSAVFLDRDGTIIRDARYLADPDRIAFIDGAIEGLQALTAAGFRLIVATNQSGIARGLYSIEQYLEVEARLEELLREHGIEFDAVYFCPHHPDFTGPCDCRKPAVGMFRAAERNLGIDLAGSVYIGDRLRDVQPALELGGWGILVRTGPDQPEPSLADDGIDIVADLREAARLIMEKNRATS